MITNVFEEINSYSLGFSNSYSIGMNLLRGYHHIPAQKNDELQNKGRLLLRALRGVNALYKNAIVKKDEDLLLLFETGMLRDAKIKALHRSGFLEGRQQLPLLFRADSTDLGQFVDFQVGMRGLGYIYALRTAMSNSVGDDAYYNLERLHGLLDMFVSNLKANAHRLIFWPAPWNFPDDGYFLGKIFPGMAASGNALPRVLFKLEQANGSVIKQLYVAPRDFYRQSKMGAGFYWNAWLQRLFFNFWFDAIEKYRKKELEIEPPPNLLHEQKLLSALVHDEEFSGYFSPEEKELFPETYVIKRGLKIQSDGRTYTLQDIVEMPRNERSYVIKYAGLDFNNNWGGRAVYRIRKISKMGTENVIKTALLSYERRRDPWILQREVSCRENVEYLDMDTKAIRVKNLYKLYRPYFICMPDKDETALLDTLVLFRGNFKVHATKDCVIGLTSVKK